MFPPVETADDIGLLCWGGDYEIDTLLEAYRSGIFPWPHEGYPPLWFALPERAILEFDRFHVSRSLRKQLRRSHWQVRIDEDFAAVISACAEPRDYADGTWVWPEIVEAYTRLHHAGFAHCVGVYDGDELIGGLYGVAIGGYFAGESMFHRRAGASKMALVALVETFRERGANWIDVQQLTPLFETFGAREIPRHDFMKKLHSALNAPDLFPQV